ncbi:RagB/SusD family nutrient uptake outer membrane protein [Chitinophaga sancti]|uniref:RagB/SusD family nutrient uptake outer membrane protein n=1 Tax=Chitinophaga sancti TaxID=1004 RepID=A0A1K1SBS1_9BACT|nr:RagB/SusD family nutrient uptake outer membrane protein [Chitinophaga sancti]WQD63548.1 RagB/SusD family nutrient uptake outer membrane protein [Chitinophaga sancti]WQG90826.1 RagB/SusD family nutrient uptake outer membrane protein [Chitinophaga sancti]SFW81674.1 Starch-binding associating with outer membrane [Chitinophaga sancti]
MKRIFLAIATCAVLGSCSKDFLNQSDPNKLTVDNYFATENDVLLAVNGVYQSLRSSDCIGENSGLYLEERSDNTGRNDYANSGEPFQFNDFSVLASNTWVKSHWSALYQTISRANVVLSNIDKVPFTSNDKKNGYIAETKFLRALIYFHLVRQWGAVPLVTTQLTTSDEVTAYTYRVADTVVYAQIITDLKDVLASGLPDFQTGDKIGRASKAAANGLLGQVYLTMARTVNDGQTTAHLQDAKTYLEACYNKRKFGQLSEIPYADVFDVAKKTTCPELIMQIVYKQGDATYSSSIAANNQAAGQTINSQKKATGIGGNVTPDLIDDYESGDPRMTYSVKFADTLIVRDYFITKFRDVSDAAGTAGYGGNDWILMRYADIILMLAEVNNYLGDETTAIAYLNQVRARAGMSDYATALLNASYKAKYPTLTLAILHERRIELAFENQRWYDLLRTMTTDELITYFHAKNASRYGNAVPQHFSAKDRYYPIPYDEYKLNPTGMYQNSGY